MFGTKKAKKIADKLGVGKAFAKLTKKKNPAELSPAEKVRKRNDSQRERRRQEPAV